MSLLPVNRRARDIPLTKTRSRPRGFNFPKSLFDERTNERMDELIPVVVVVVSPDHEVCASRRVCTLYLKHCFVTAGRLWVAAMSERERKKESERARGGVSATARIINNKGIGIREIDGCTMTDVPSITSSLFSRRIDRVPPLPFSRPPPLSPTVFFLPYRSLVRLLRRRAVSSRYYRTRSYYHQAGLLVRQEDYLPRLRLFSGSSYDDCAISESSYLASTY